MAFGDPWRHLFDADYSCFSRFDWTHPRTVLGPYPVVLSGGQLFIPPKNWPASAKGNPWAHYLRELRVSAAREHADVALAFAFGDVCRAREETSFAFVASRVASSPSPLWFDWEHVERLLDSRNDPPIEAIHEAQRHRERRAVWRGTGQFALFPAGVSTIRERIDFMRRDARLHLVDVSTQRPDLLDARLSGLKPSAVRQPHWLEETLARETRWKEFDVIPAQRYYSAYQTVVVVDGIGPAFRVGEHLRQGQTVLLQESRFLQHFSALLKPWEHYVPLQASLADLTTRLEWARDHPAEVCAIGLEGCRFYERYLSREPSLALSNRILDALAERQAGVAHRQLAEELGLVRFEVGDRPRESRPKKRWSAPIVTVEGS